MKKIFLFLFVLIMFGCTKVKHGTISNINIVPRHTETYTYYTTYMIGKQIIHSPHTGIRTVETKAYITVYNIDNNKDTIYNKVKIKSYYVDKLHIGQYISDDEYYKIVE